MTTADRVVRLLSGNGRRHSRIRAMRQSGWQGRAGSGDLGHLYVWLGVAAAIVAGLALWRPARRAMTGRNVADVMIYDVVTIAPSASLVDAARTMRDANVGMLPVVAADRTLHGVVTDRDLVVRALADGGDPRVLTVADCSTRTLACARPEWDVDDAMRVMSDSQVGRLPVVDDGNRLVGIVTLSSLAFRASEDDETLETARDVSRRSARAAS